MAPPTILLLSAYGAASHRAWADWLTAAHPDFVWQRLELPGRHFRWRIRGNPLSWLEALPAQRPDHIIATSMVDLATLRGLHPRLADVPSWYYFHENQFAYPVSERQVRSVEPRIVQLYGALCADRLLFNSAFNRDSFLEGVAALLRRMPDRVPRDVCGRLKPKCELLPVPVTPVAASAERDPRLVLWNHRWEYDKDPDRFADAMIALAGRGHDFRLALLGGRPRQPPGALARLRARLPDRIVADGRVDTDTYRGLLGRAGIAISTTRHEFQGLAMLEAASAGARPLVPDALCYPEQYPATHRYPPGTLEALVARIEHWWHAGLPPMADVMPWCEEMIAPRWRHRLDQISMPPPGAPASPSSTL